MNMSSATRCSCVRVAGSASVARIVIADRAIAPPNHSLVPMPATNANALSLSSDRGVAHLRL